jgi:hypothetical protein
LIAFAQQPFASVPQIRYCLKISTLAPVTVLPLKMQTFSG